MSLYDREIKDALERISGWLSWIALWLCFTAIGTCASKDRTIVVKNEPVTESKP